VIGKAARVHMLEESEVKEFTITRIRKQVDNFVKFGISGKQNMFEMAISSTGGQKVLAPDKNCLQD
jgi:hypothetical protein